MLRRLLVGLLVGLIVGGLLAAGLVAGLNKPTFEGVGGAAIAYLAAGLAGVLTGLVTGKPIWASGAKVEAGLKAFFGGVLAVGAMFALRRWGGSFTLDLRAIDAGGPGPLGMLAAGSLPLIAAVLGSFFELDNSGSPDKEGAKPEARARVAEIGAGSKARPRVAAAPPAAERAEEAEAAPAKRARR